MKIKELIESWTDVKYYPTPLRMGKYRNPEDPRTGMPSSQYDPKVHKLNYELADVIDELIERGVPAKTVVVNPKDLWASQDWLSEFGSGEDTFPEYTDLPVVLKDGNDLNIADGHHRISKALRDNKMIRVYLFDIEDLYKDED